MEKIEPEIDILTHSQLWERGEIVVWPTCPFIQFAETDLRILNNISATFAGKKDISFDPLNRRFSGRRSIAGENAVQLEELFLHFSQLAEEWLLHTCPEYEGGVVRDRVTWHLSEEATRLLRHNARNDLLHIDHFPTRPSNGRRILRVFINLDQHDPNVWSTADRIREIVQQYGRVHPIPKREQESWLSTKTRWPQFFLPNWLGRSEYDSLMLRIHHWLKNNEDYQVKSARKLWSFPSGCMWAVCTDSLSYAWLRGKRVLEHSFFINQNVWQAVDHAPISILCQQQFDSVNS